MASAPHPAEDFYVPAKGYLEATKMVVTSPHYAGRELLTLLPVQMLFGFSVELFLKAWLLKAGLSKDALRSKPYGHHLENLYAEASAKGLPSIPGLSEVVKLLHGPHTRFEYRYMKQGTRYDVMGPLQVTATLDQLDIAVDRKIGASRRMGKEPGH